MKKKLATLIKTARKANNGGKGYWSLRAVADRAGISNGYLSQIENGQINNPLPDILKSLSKALRLQYKDLMQAADYLSPEKEKPKTIDIPILGAVSANHFNLAYQEAIPSDYITMNYALIKKDNCFALKIDGDCLIEAGIFHGDHVIILPTVDVKNGDLVVARIHDEATIKKFYKNDKQIILQPCNKKVEPILISSKEKNFEILGKVISSIRMF